MPWHIGQVAIHNPFVPFNFIAHWSEERGGPNHIRTVFPIPGNAKEGDLLIVVLNGRVNGASLSTPGFTPVGPVGAGQGPGGWDGGCWVGYCPPKNVPVLDANGVQTGWKFPDLTGFIQAAGGGFTQFTGASVAAFRGEEIAGIVRRPLLFKPDRLVAGPIQGGMPAVPGKGSGVIGVTASTGGIGGSYGSYNWTVGTGGVYYRLSGSDGSYSTQDFGRTDMKAGVPATGSPQLDDDGKRSWAIGLR